MVYSNCRLAPHSLDEGCKRIRSEEVSGFDTNTSYVAFVTVCFVPFLSLLSALKSDLNLYHSSEIALSRTSLSIVSPPMPMLPGLPAAFGSVNHHLRERVLL